MKRVQHLEHSFRKVFFDRNPGAESTRVMRAGEDNGNDVAGLRDMIQGLGDFAHRRDVEDVKRRPREVDARNTIVDYEFDVLEFAGHKVAGSLKVIPS